MGKLFVTSQMLEQMTESWVSHFAPRQVHSLQVT